MLLHREPVVTGLQHRLCLAYTFLATSSLVGYQAVGSDVEERYTGVVLPHDTGREVAIHKGVDVVAAEHIAAPGIILVRHTHLAEQCGSQVALVHQHLHAARLTNGTAQPQHGSVEELG